MEVTNNNFGGDACKITNNNLGNDACKITNIKCRDDGGKITLTWHWPEGVEQVHIFIGDTVASPKLYTLQEYKKRGGFSAKKCRGVNMFSVFPFTPDDDASGAPASDDSDTPAAYQSPSHTPTSENTIRFIVTTPITCTVTEKSTPLAFATRYKNHEITLSAPHDIPSDTICYAKSSTNAIFTFTDPLYANQPLTRTIRTEKDDHLSFYINKDVSPLYTIKN